MVLIKREGNYIRLSSQRNVPRKTRAESTDLWPRGHAFTGSSGSGRKAGHRTQDTGRQPWKDVMDLFGDTARIKQRLGWQASRSWDHFQTLRTASMTNPSYAIQELNVAFVWNIVQSLLAVFNPTGEAWPHLLIMVHAWNRQEHDCEHPTVFCSSLTLMLRCWVGFFFSKS